MKSFVDFNKEVLSEGYTPSAGELARDLIKASDEAFKSKYGMSKKQAEQHYSSSNLKEGATMTDTIDEKLVGKQKKLDVNKNGKLDAEDFKKLRKEETDLEEAKCKEDAPFTGGVPSKGSIKDKSGAVHTPMSRARHAAKEALKQYSKTKKEEVELDEWKVESEWKKSDPEDKRTGMEKAKALAAKAATPTKLKPKKTFEEVELDEGLHPNKVGSEVYMSKSMQDHGKGTVTHYGKDGHVKVKSHDTGKIHKFDYTGKGLGNIFDPDAYDMAIHGSKNDIHSLRNVKEEVELDEEINIFCEEMISHSDFHDKIAMHKKAGNNVVDYDHSEKKAHITTIDKEGMKRKVVYTPKGVSMQNMGQHQGDDKDETGEKIKKADTTGVKRGRGRPAGSKSGANLANAPAKREFRGVGTHSLNISSNRSMREEVDLEEAEMSPEMKAKQERIVKGMKKSYSSFVSKYGDKAKNVMYATATKMAMKEETELEEAVATGNPGFGYHGEHEPEVADKKYSKAHATVKKIAGEAGHLKDAKKPNELVKSYLDSKRGRHLAGNETDHEYIKRDFGQFKKNSQ